MAFKSIIHISARPEFMQELHKTIDQFRAEKAAKYLADIGVNYDTIHEYIHKDRIHNTESEVSDHKACYLSKYMRYQSR